MKHRLYDEQTAQNIINRAINDAHELYPKILKRIELVLLFLLIEGIVLLLFFMIIPHMQNVAAEFGRFLFVISLMMGALIYSIVVILNPSYRPIEYLACRSKRFLTPAIIKRYEALDQEWKTVEDVANVFRTFELRPWLDLLSFQGLSFLSKENHRREIWKKILKIEFKNLGDYFSDHLNFPGEDFPGISVPDYLMREMEDVFCEPKKWTPAIWTEAARSLKLYFVHYDNGIRPEIHEWFDLRRKALVDFANKKLKYDLVVGNYFGN